MNAAEDDPGAALARQPADLVAAQRVAGVDADADDVARRELRGVDGVERFVHEVRIAPPSPVAAASTYSQRGVMTATPNETSLGLIR